MEFAVNYSRLATEHANIDLDLTAIEEFEGKGKTNQLFAALAEITTRHDGLWSVEAEKYLLANANRDIKMNTHPQQHAPEPLHGAVS